MDRTAWAFVGTLVAPNRRSPVSGELTPGLWGVGELGWGGDGEDGFAGVTFSQVPLVLPFVPLV